MDRGVCCGQIQRKRRRPVASNPFWPYVVCAILRRRYSIRWIYDPSGQAYQMSSYCVSGFSWSGRILLPFKLGLELEHELSVFGHIVVFENFFDFARFGQFRYRIQAKMF